MGYKFTTIETSTGRVLAHAELPSLAMVRAQDGQEGQTLLLDVVPADNDLCYWNGSTFVKIGIRPSTYHEYDWAAKDWFDPRELPEVQSAQIAVINAGFSAAAAELTKGYPDDERATWGTQQAEALAWNVDDTTPTPYLDTIAASRSIDRVEMIRKTLENVNHYLQVSAELIGKRQALRDAILNAKTIEAVKSIIWTTQE